MRICLADVCGVGRYVGPDAGTIEILVRPKGECKRTTRSMILGASFLKVRNNHVGIREV